MMSTSMVERLSRIPQFLHEQTMTGGRASIPSPGDRNFQSKPRNFAYLSNKSFTAAFTFFKNRIGLLEVGHSFKGAVNF